LYINTAQNLDRVADQLVPFYSDIPKSQYEWMIFAASATLLPAGIFIFVEIFRDSSNESNEKPTMETYAEGLCLLLLTLGWIPAVIVLTTPGGFASVIGNAYFFTWATTIFVLETTMWFIHDSRGGVHTTLVQKELEYQKRQQSVLEATRKLQQDAADRRQEDGEGDSDDVDSPRLQPTLVERKDTDDRPIFGGEAMLTEQPPVAFTTVKEPTSTTATEPPAPATSADGFEMRNEAEEDENIDDSIRQEMQMRESNRRAYFDTLDDILE